MLVKNCEHNDPGMVSQTLFIESEMRDELLYDQDINERRRGAEAQRRRDKT